MPTDDTSDPQPLGFSIDIGEILRGATAPKPRRRTTTTRATGGGSMTQKQLDTIVRRAMRVELEDVATALKALATEVVRLRRANEDLADKVDRLSRR
jgi:hypothetical protein